MPILSVCDYPWWFSNHTSRLKTWHAASFHVSNHEVEWPGPLVRACQKSMNHHCHSSKPLQWWQSMEHLLLLGDHLLVTKPKVWFNAFFLSTHYDHHTSSYINLWVANFQPLWRHVWGIWVILGSSHSFETMHHKMHHYSSATAAPAPPGVAAWLSPRPGAGWPCCTGPRRTRSSGPRRSRLNKGPVPSNRNRQKSVDFPTTELVKIGLIMHNGMIVWKNHVQS